MPSQAFFTWLETFGSYTSEELDDRIDALKDEISIFSSQALGSKSFTRDLAELRDQLAAATRAKKEKGTPNVKTTGVTDFSGITADSDTGCPGPNPGPSSFNWPS